MSRQIDLSQPLSDEDRQYLVDRADVANLERNAAWTAGAEFEDSGAGKHGADEVDATGSPAAFEDRTVEQLKASISAYNAKYEDDDAVPKVNVSGTKDELLQRIVEAQPAFEL